MLLLIINYKYKLDFGFAYNRDTSVRRTPRAVPNALAIVTVRPADPRASMASARIHAKDRVALEPIVICAD